MNIIKRDGRIVQFDKEKIITAILKAFGAVGTIDEYAKAKAENIANYIEDKVSERPEPYGVEEIQDLVEQGLMSLKHKDVAKAYILYREERNKVRQGKTALMKLIGKKIDASDVQNQNANMDEHSFGGRMGEARNELMKDYALNYCVSKQTRDNHINNEVYIHDLDSYAVGEHNCLTIPFDDLLAKGFNTRQTDVRPARSINTAFQLVAVIFQLQSLQQFGGVSASHLDWTMVPYVRLSFFKHWRDGHKYILHDENADNLVFFEDKSITDDYYKDGAYEYAMALTERELMQAVQGRYHNLNTLQSGSGNQLPFTSINYGTCTLPEGRMVTKALLEGSIEGVGKVRKTPIFPCGIFQCMKGVNRAPGDPNYDLFQLALRSTAQRLYPNYVNVDWSVNAGYDRNDPKTYVSTMGCRTYNGADINAEPFMELLDQKIHEAKDSLVERYKHVISQDPSSAKFMYENGLILGYDGKTVESAMKHGTLVIGQLGLAETLQILIGKDHTTPEGMELAKRIAQLFKDRCAEFKKDLHLNIGVYYTPAENLCYTAMKKFKKKYGEIPNVSDREYFTNSIHVPVWKQINPFEKIDIESQLTGYSNAGCITYVELDSGAKNNLEALEALVNYAMDKDIPYFAINVPNDTCLDCGYTDEFNDECPMCHSHNIQQLRRVTGYLTGDYKTAFNYGKQKETEDRFKHSQLLED